MTISWKAQMARKLVEQEDPEELIMLVDAVLPAMFDVLSSEQLKDFAHHLFQTHLATLLASLAPADREALLQELQSAIAAELASSDGLNEDRGP